VIVGATVGAAVPRVASLKDRFRVWQYRPCGDISVEDAKIGADRLLLTSRHESEWSRFHRVE
jgi:hypothetical protein